MHDLHPGESPRPHDLEPVKIEPLGDRGILVRFAARPSRALTQRLFAFATAARAIEGVIDAAPGHRTVMIEADPQAVRAILGQLDEVEAQAQAVASTRHVVQIEYDGEDFGWVCEHTQLSPREIVKLHSGRTYDVRIIGSPGFIYLSPVHPKLTIPRRDEPRALVAAGSVGIGGRQTGIYGRPRPGGWRIIGTIGEVPRVVPGDLIRFVP